MQFPKTKALALRVLAERLEHGKPTAGLEKLFRVNLISSNEGMQPYAQ